MKADCRGFSALDGFAKRRLVDGLAANLSVLGLSIKALLDGDDEADRDEAAAAHRSALKAYTFFLGWLCTHGEAEAAQATLAGTAGGVAGRHALNRIASHPCCLLVSHLVLIDDASRLYRFTG